MRWKILRIGLAMGVLGGCADVTAPIDRRDQSRPCTPPAMLLEAEPLSSTDADLQVAIAYARETLIPALAPDPFASELDLAVARLQRDRASAPLATCRALTTAWTAWQSLAENPETAIERETLRLVLALVAPSATTPAAALARRP